MNPPEGMVVDHIDGDPLNNQRDNLRICSNAENLWNQRKRDGCKGKYKGVSYNRRDRVYFATVMRNGRRFNSRTTKSEEEVALAYNLLAIEHFGEFAKLNVVPPSREWMATKGGA